MFHQPCDGLMLNIINIVWSVGVIDSDRFSSGIRIDPYHRWAILSTLVRPNTSILLVIVWVSLYYALAKFIPTLEVFRSSVF